MSWEGSPKSSEDGEKHIWPKIFHESYCTKYIKYSQIQKKKRCMTDSPYLNYEAFSSAPQFKFLNRILTSIYKVYSSQSILTVE